MSKLDEQEREKKEGNVNQFTPRIRSIIDSSQLVDWKNLHNTLYFFPKEFISNRFFEFPFFEPKKIITWVKFSDLKNSRFDVNIPKNKISTFEDLILRYINRYAARQRPMHESNE